MLLFQLMSNTFFHIAISYIGLLYAKSEIMRDGNDQVLNSLKEGLFVIDEAKGRMRFINKAGYDILKENYLTSASRLSDDTHNTKDSFVDREKKQFALIDKKMFEVGLVKDSHQLAKKILAVNTYESLDDIIAW